MQGNSVPGARVFVDYLGPYTNPTLETYAVQYGSSFLSGANANTYAANSSNCYSRILNSYFTEVPLLQWRYFYGAFDDDLYNTTRALANFTNTAMVCFDVVENFVIYGRDKIILFGDFTSLLLGFF